MLTIVGIHAVSADTQQLTPSVSQCELPEVNFLPAPESTTGFVEVEVDFFLLDIIEINDRQNRFTLDFTLDLKWLDSRLVSNTGEADKCLIKLSEIWHPHLILVNSRESLTDYDGAVVILNDGWVNFSKRFTRDFTVNLELRRFPFDEQALTVEFASMLYGPDEVRFVDNAVTTGIYEKAGIPGWKLESLTSSVPDHPIETRTTNHSSLHFTVNVARQSGYYVWRLILPLALITLMAWSVFWLEPTQLAPQVTVSTGAIFSLMAFLIGQGQILPAIPYLSIADVLIVTSVIMVFAAFGETVLTGTLAQNGKLELAKWIDRHGRWLYLVLIIINLLLALA